jgi:hypothetical protein
MGKTLRRPWLQPFDVMVKGDLFSITNCADYWKVTSGEWSSTEPREEDYILRPGFHCRHRAARSRSRTQRVRLRSTAGVSQKPK